MCLLETEKLHGSYLQAKDPRNLVVWLSSSWKVSESGKLML